MPSRGGGGFGGSRSGGGGSRGGSRSGGFSGGRVGGGFRTSGPGGYHSYSSRRVFHTPPPMHTPHSGGGGGCCSGCSGAAVFAVISVFMVIIFLFGAIGSGFSSPTVPEQHYPIYSDEIPESTKHREKLDSGLLKPIDAYITDEARVLYDDVNVRKSMEYFYEKTGVQPYLHVTDQINGMTNPKSSEIEAFAFDRYMELFQDEGHLLIVLVRFKNYDYDFYFYYLPGDDAWTVFDEEAGNIFLAALSAYYNEGGNYDKALQQAFTVTADRIMDAPSDTQPGENKPAEKEKGISIGGYILVAVVVTAVVAAVILGIRKKKEKELEQEDDYEAYKRKMEGP